MEEGRRREQLIREIEWLRQQSEQAEAKAAASESDADGIDGGHAAAGEAGVADVMQLLLASDGAGPAVGPSDAPGNELADDVVVSQLHHLAAITGIIFDRMEHTIVPDDVGTADPRRRYHLTGSVLGVSFAVKFDAREESKVIDALHLEVPPECVDEFGDCLEWTQTTRSPLVFFQAFVQYAEANQERATALQDLKGAFPDLVSLPLGVKYGSIARIEGPSISFNAKWRITVEREGRISASISLVADSSGNTASTQLNKLLIEAPHQFGGLVRVIGPRAALISVAQAVSQ